MRARVLRQVRAEVSKALRIEVPGWRRTRPPPLRMHHLTMLALAKAGYAYYFAAMAPELRATFNADVVAFGRVVASARAVAEK
jgi:hypothetical protein